ncbi:MAG: response regulator transcription factor [Acidobacteriota bacterium]
MARILIVEDEAHLAGGLKFNLEAEGHDADIVADGAEARDRLLAQRGAWDLVLLDVMLPGADGFEVARALRASGDYVPILMLTARGRPEDVLQGFDAGADDYLAKPFELSILLARLNGLLRRHAWMRQAVEAFGADAAVVEPPEPPEPRPFTFAGITFDPTALELRVGDTHHHLTVMECELLAYLIKNAGRPVSRKAILGDVWNLHEDTDTRAIDNFIVRLRRYLGDDPANPRHLVTVRSVGYKFLP